VSKFNWSYVSDKQVNSMDKYVALYYYCSEYHQGQGDWRYKVLSKLPFKPGPSHKDILDEENFVALEYYQHLLSLFETNNVCDIDLVIDEIGVTVADYWSEVHDITVSLNGTWNNAAELARDIYEQIQSCDWGYQVDLANIFTCISPFHYPLSTEVDNILDEDDWGDYAVSLWLGFDWWNKPEEPVDTCTGCVYFNGSSDLLRCAVNPLAKERCFEYETA